jgi:hypothetical protein
VATAPTLDVTLKTQVTWLENEPRIAVSANDWITIPFGELLHRLDVNRQEGSNAVTALFPGKQGIVARLGLPHDEHQDASLTAGGFFTSAKYRSFPGVIVGRATNLARSSAVPFTFEELCATDIPSSVRIILHDFFDWKLPDRTIKRVLFWQAAQSGELKLDDDVILAPVMKTGASPRPDDASVYWDLEVLATFKSMNDEPFPWSLPLLCVEALAERWRAKPRDLVAPLHYVHDGRDLLKPAFGMPVGTYAGTPLSTTVLPIVKPS